MSVLTGDQIRGMGIIKGARDDLFRGASYDIRVGKEFLSPGAAEIDALKQGGVLRIPAHDFVILESEEGFAMPKNVVGRYDLRRAVFPRGLLLQPGLHLDPGYKGKLVSFLFNLSADAVTLRRGDTFASVEFSFTSQDVSDDKLHASYRQPEPMGFEDLLPAVRARESGLAQLYERFERQREDFEDFSTDLKTAMAGTRDTVRDVHRRLDGLLGTVLMVVAFLVAVVGLTVGPQQVASVLTLREGIDVMPVVYVVAGAFVAVVVIMTCIICYIMTRLWHPYELTGERVGELLPQLEQQLEKRLTERVLERLNSKLRAAALEVVPEVVREEMRRRQA